MTKIWVLLLAINLSLVDASALPSIGLQSAPNIRDVVLHPILGRSPTTIASSAIPTFNIASSAFSLSENKGPYPLQPDAPYYKQCGRKNGYLCVEGLECCSTSGWCGATAEYCCTAQQGWGYFPDSIPVCPIASEVAAKEAACEFYVRVPPLCYNTPSTFLSAGKCESFKRACTGWVATCRRTISEAILSEFAIDVNATLKCDQLASRCLDIDCNGY